MIEEFLTSCVNIWWGCQKKKTAELRHLILLSRVYILSTVGDAPSH
jgi:hypothetical protein